MKVNAKYTRPVFNTPITKTNKVPRRNNKMVNKQGDLISPRLYAHAKKDYLIQYGA